MKNPTERQLMRLLHGELSSPEARQLERRIEEDADLAATYRRLTEAWTRLQLPAPSAPPAGFAAGVVAAAHKIRGGELSWALAPAWARAGAATALTAGLVLGAVFGGGFAETPVSLEVEIQADVDADAAPLSMAEVYWLALEDSEGQFPDLAEESEGTVR